MDSLIVFFVLLGISIVIAYFIGRERQIGFGWSLFFCLFLTIIGGLIAIFTSTKSSEPSPIPSRGKIIAGWVLIVLFTLSVIGQVFDPYRGHRDITDYNGVAMAIGLIGLGYYLIQRGKGKRFDFVEINMDNKDNE